MLYLESERRVSIICHILYFIWFLGAHDACKFFKTECLPSEYCVPRVLSGMVWPGEYKCVCRKGWQKVRGRGCVGKLESGICACANEKKCANLTLRLNFSRSSAWYKEKKTKIKNKLMMGSWSPVYVKIGIRNNSFVWIW